MSVIEIVPEVFGVGVQDPHLKLFDVVMELTHGTSYNAYLIRGTDHTAVIDTVKAEFFGEFADNLAKVVDLQEIDYLVIQHAEPDHAGSIRMLLDLVPELTIVTNYTAYTFLKKIVNRDFKVKFVAHDGELDLEGKHYGLSGPRCCIGRKHSIVIWKKRGSFSAVIPLAVTIPMNDGSMI